jgi:hypothetical protein
VNIKGDRRSKYDGKDFRFLLNELVRKIEEMAVEKATRDIAEAMETIDGEQVADLSQEISPRGKEPYFGLSATTDGEVREELGTQVHH